MDVSALAGAQAAIKALIDLTKVATNAVVDHKVKQTLIDVQAAVLTVQQQLGDAYAERLHLTEELQQLRQKVRELEAASALLDGYELVSVEDGKFLYKSKSGQVEHFACPTCFGTGKVSILQAVRTGSTQRRYDCAGCSFKLWVGPSDPIKPPQLVRRVGWTRDW